MFNIGKIASGLLDSIDSVAHNSATDGEVKMSATEIRSLNKRNRSVDGGNAAMSAVGSSPGVSASASSNSLSSVRSGSGFDIDTAKPAINEEASSDVLVGSVSETDGTPETSAGADGTAASPLLPPVTPPVHPKPAPAPLASKAVSVEADSSAIEALNQECLELETENSSLKEEIKDVWANFKGLQDRSSATETELQALKLEHSVLLGEKEGSAEEAKIKVLTHRLEDARTREAQLEADVRRLNEHNAELQEQVTEHYSVVSTLKNREEERVLGATQEHMRALKAAQNHAMELENRCAALSTTNADLHKEKHALSDRVQQQNADSAMQAEYTALQSKHALLESQHASLSTQFSQCEQRLDIAESKLVTAEAQCQQFSREKNESAYNHGVKVKELEQALAKATRTSNGDSGKTGEPHPSTAVVNELQLQCSTLSQQIMKKQGVILELQAEKSTLKSRLNDYLKRIQDLEAAAASATDLEVYSSSQSSYGSRGSQPYQRAYNGNAKNQNTLTNQLIMLNILPKTVVNQASSGESSNIQLFLYALEGFDSYCYMILRAIATSPILRCVFMLYILALHFWSFLLIVYHATVLDMDGGDGNALNVTAGTPEGAAANIRKIVKVANGAYKNTVGPDGPGSIVG